MTLDNLRHDCKCGHHRDTHFESKGACLGMRCDCAIYRDVSDPTPDTVPPRPKTHPYWCRCFYCKQALGLT